MSSITDVALAFFGSCETGKGWEVCKSWCSPNATFSAQAENGTAFTGVAMPGWH